MAAAQPGRAPVETGAMTISSYRTAAAYRLDRIDLATAQLLAAFAGGAGGGRRRASPPVSRQAPPPRP